MNKKRKKNKKQKTKCPGKQMQTLRSGNWREGKNQQIMKKIHNRNHGDDE